MSLLLPPLVPGGRFLTGHLGEVRRDFLGFLTRIAREHGDCVQFHRGHRRVVLLNHPALIEQVLLTDSRNFSKHFGLRMYRPLVGDGLATSEGQLWLRQRRLMQPAFLRDRLTTYADAIVACTESMLDSWRHGETRDLHADMVGLTLRVAARTLFGSDLENETEVVRDAFRQALDCFDDRFRSLLPLPLWIPTPANLRLRRSLRRLEGVLHRLIARRRAAGKEGDDLLSVLLHARDEEDGSRMSDRQLRDEVMTLLLAGHETTALTLSWALHLLSVNPAVEERLLGEVQRVLGDRPPAATDLPRLVYTGEVVLETLRLYPPAYVIGREALRDGEVGSYRLPRGTTVMLSQWVTQRDPRFFDNPLVFDPSRWSGGLQTRLPKCAYFPFGAGPRACIGNTFALMEATLALAAIVRRFRFLPVPDHPVVPWPSLTLRPRQGIRVVLSQRGLMKSCA
jgi:cytochrome P450